MTGTMATLLDPRIKPVGTYQSGLPRTYWVTGTSPYTMAAGYAADLAYHNGAKYDFLGIWTWQGETDAEGSLLVDDVPADDYLLEVGGARTLVPATFKDTGSRVTRVPGFYPVE